MRRRPLRRAVLGSATSDAASALAEVEVVARHSSSSKDWMVWMAGSPRTASASSMISSSSGSFWSPDLTRLSKSSPSEPALLSSFSEPLPSSSSESALPSSSSEPLPSSSLQSALPSSSSEPLVSEGRACCGGGLFHAGGNIGLTRLSTLPPWWGLFHRRDGSRLKEPSQRHSADAALRTAGRKEGRGGEEWRDRGPAQVTSLGMLVDVPAQTVQIVRNPKFPRAKNPQILGSEGFLIYEKIR